MDESIVKKIIYNKKYLNAKYPQYFQPEIQPIINKESFTKYETNEEEEGGEEDEKGLNNEYIEELKKEISDNFYENRTIGENDDAICKMIQKDLIEEFITYVNKNFIPVKSTIRPSIYETNNFLLKNKDVTLIEYAVFYGSIQIFNYLRQNGAELKSSLWLYAVHGQNPEIIQFLEENKILQLNNDSNISVKQIFIESIKCHHIDVANYIQDNYLQNNKECSKDTLINGLKYYNFMLIQYNIDTLFYSCKYDFIV